MATEIKRAIKIGVIGASGYTGADAVRLLLAHSGVEIAALAANTHAGRELADLFPQFAAADLPTLAKVEAIDWSGIDAVICGLPHAAAQDVIATLPEHLKIIDMSADFRLRDAAVYEKWYGRKHSAPDLLAGAVYGLPEHYGEQIKQARLVACAGCYPTASLLLLLPLVKAGLIEANGLIIDAKSGVSGSGRALKESSLFVEAAEGTQAYGVAAHRHAPEIEQELSAAGGGAEVVVSFTPHLIPMNRGELISAYASASADAKTIRAELEKFYADAPFVNIAPADVIPSTRHVRGSNFASLNVFDDRVSGRVIMFAAIDNLVKGSSGQAVQVMNLMFGLPETQGLEQQAIGF